MWRARDQLRCQGCTRASLRGSHVACVTSPGVMWGDGRHQGSLAPVPLRAATIRAGVALCRLGSSPCGLTLKWQRSQDIWVEQDDLGI
jgi:hypothetical protein